MKLTYQAKTHAITEKLSKEKNKILHLLPQLIYLFLLVCDWLHSVGQNHFYVMMSFIQGCCFIQSLHLSYELQEDSVQDSK